MMREIYSKFIFIKRLILISTTGIGLSIISLVINKDFGENSCFYNYAILGTGLVAGGVLFLIKNLFIPHIFIIVKNDLEKIKKEILLSTLDEILLSKRYSKLTKMLLKIFLNIKNKSSVLNSLFYATVNSHVSLAETEEELDN